MHSHKRSNVSYVSHDICIQMICLSTVEGFSQLAERHLDIFKEILYMQRKGFVQYVAKSTIGEQNERYIVPKLDSKV